MRIAIIWSSILLIALIVFLLVSSWVQFHKNPQPQDDQPAYEMKVLGRITTSDFYFSNYLCTITLHNKTFYATFNPHNGQIIFGPEVEEEN